MSQSIQIAVQVYLMGFVISMFIAALIKGMLILIRRFSREKKTENN
jgi:hypothetical protein